MIGLSLSHQCSADLISYHPHNTTEVPTYTPDTALKLFMLFLDGTWFDPKAFSPSEEGDGGKGMGLKGAGEKEKEEGMAAKGNEREVSQVAVKTLLRVM